MCRGSAVVNVWWMWRCFGLGHGNEEEDRVDDGVAAEKSGMAGIKAWPYFLNIVNKIKKVF